MVDLGTSDRTQGGTVLMVEKSSCKSTPVGLRCNVVSIVYNLLRIL